MIHLQRLVSLTGRENRCCTLEEQCDYNWEEQKKEDPQGPDLVKVNTESEGHTPNPCRC